MPLAWLIDGRHAQVLPLYGFTSDGSGDLHIRARVAQTHPIQKN
jgi:hypothetical protein